jgi:hypothetical protein
MRRILLGLAVIFFTGCSNDTIEEPLTDIEANKITEKLQFLLSSQVNTGKGETFEEKYGKVNFENSFVFDDETGATLYPVLEGKTITRWLVGGLDENHSIQFKIRRKNISSESISLSENGKMVFEKTKKVHFQPLNKTTSRSGMICGDVYRQVCGYYDANGNGNHDTGMDGELQCNWFYAGTECITDSSFDIDDGGGGYTPESNEWEDPFGGGTTAMCAVGYIKDANGNCVRDQIFDTGLKPCMQKILSDLKNLKNNNDITQIIQSFAGNTPGLNWELKDGSLTGQTAETNVSYNKVTKTATTVFDSQAWKDASEISWARTILHESIHAYIVAAFNVNYNQYKKTFADMINDFVNLQYNNNSNDTHHAEFVRNYVGDIADALKEYGISKGYNHNSQFYEDMAWGGLTHWAKKDSAGNIIKDSNGKTILEETPWFKSVFQNKPNDKSRIINTVAIELTGRDAHGNIQTQKGKKAGC